MGYVNKIIDRAGTQFDVQDTRISGLGTANGVATLDSNSKVPAAQLPSQTLSFNLPAITAGGTANVTGLTGVTADTVGVFGLSQSATSAWYKAAADAQLMVTAQATGQITVKAMGKAIEAGCPCVLNIIK